MENKPVAVLEGQLFNFSLPASDRLYYVEDLNSKARKMDVLISDPSYRGTLSSGPDTRLNLWHRRRSELDIDRGPCMYFVPFIEAPITIKAASSFALADLD